MNTTSPAPAKPDTASAPAKPDTAPAPHSRTNLYIGIGAFVVLLVLIGIGLLIWYFVDKRNSKKACTLNSDCPAGEICDPSSSMCVKNTVCTTNSDCSATPNTICIIPTGGSTGTCSVIACANTGTGTLTGSAYCNSLVSGSTCGPEGYCESSTTSLFF